jgi:cytochrome c-type biogenesis protein CcmH/NrfG
LSAYNQRDFTAAETFLTTHLRTHTTDTDAVFYLAMCQGLTGRFELASHTFEQAATSSDNPLTKPAQWYLALCYLHLGDAQKAHPLLENLKTDASFGEKARSTLKAIEQ